MDSLSSYLLPHPPPLCGQHGEQEVSAHRARGGGRRGGQEDSVTKAYLPLAIRAEPQR